MNQIFELILEQCVANYYGEYDREISNTALKKNRGQYLQAKSRRKKPQTQFQKHQIQEIFKFFLLIVEVV